MTGNVLEYDPPGLSGKHNADRIKRRASAPYDALPGALMKWMTRRAQPGSVRVHLVASTDGALGQIIISSYDEYDKNMGDETFEVTTLDHLMTA